MSRINFQDFRTLSKQHQLAITTSLLCPRRTITFIVRYCANCSFCAVLIIHSTANMQETMAEYEARLLRGSGVELLLAGAPSYVSHPPSTMLEDANRRKAIEEEERRRPLAPSQQPEVLLTAPAAAFTRGPTK